MPEAFDPYYTWPGIPPKDQPPNHYRLLGVERFEPAGQVEREFLVVPAQAPILTSRSTHCPIVAHRIRPTGILFSGQPA